MTLLVGGVPDVDLGQIFVFRALCGEAVALRGGELVEIGGAQSAQSAARQGAGAGREAALPCRFGGTPSLQSPL